VGAGVRVERGRGASVVLHPGAVLGAGARISAVSGQVVIGPGARLGERSVVVSRAGVVVGSGAVVGDWAAISDVEPGFLDLTRPVRLDPVAPVVIGEGAVIGAHAAVASSVPLGAEIAPYAVVWRRGQPFTRGSRVG
jgi:UDP-3-O-[3-hydroxymyristoyl] glucosamine N-acyltransferase